MSGFPVEFVQLNEGWNAEPNAPDEVVRTVGSAVILEFSVDASLYPEFAKGSRASIRFIDCARYRLGAPNDEGWYSGQCRFSGLAPSWGEFYAISGPQELLSIPGDWVAVTNVAEGPRKHYLFYLRDSTFECEAAAFDLELPGAVHP